MRPIIVGFLILVCFAVSSAQRQIAKGSFGGVGISLFKSGYGGGALARPYAGIFAKTSIAENVAVRAEMGYAHRGEETHSASAVLSYIDIPLLMDYRIILHERSALNIHFLGGIQWSMLIAAEVRNLWNPFSTFDAYPHSSKSDFGYMFGGGFGIGVGNGTMFFDVRMYVGIKNLTILSFDYPMHNRSLSFITGFEF